MGGGRFIFIVFSFKKFLPEASYLENKARTNKKGASLIKTPQRNFPPCEKSGLISEQTALYSLRYNKQKQAFDQHRFLFSAGFTKC